MDASDRRDTALMWVRAAGRAARRAVAWGTIFWAGVATVLLVSGFSEFSAPVRGVLAGLAAAAWWAGLTALRSARAAAARSREVRWMRAVLGLAGREGAVTETRLVVTQDWTTAEARAALRHCLKEGLVEPEADERGTLVYRVAPAASRSAPAPPLSSMTGPRRHAERRPPVADR